MYKISKLLSNTFWYFFHGSENMFNVANTVSYLPNPCFFLTERWFSKKKKRKKNSTSYMTKLTSSVVSRLDLKFWKLLKTLNELW